MTKALDILGSQIHAILLFDWDPIGIAGVPEAQDEYDAYIPALLAMLANQVSVEELAQYLIRLETEHIGLDARETEARHVAEKLAAVAEATRERNS